MGKWKEVQNMHNPEQKKKDKLFREHRAPAISGPNGDREVKIEVLHSSEREDERELDNRSENWRRWLTVRR